MAYQNSRWLLFWLVSLAVAGFGCSKSYITHTRLTPTNLAADDVIAVIHVQSGHQEYSDGLEKEVLECVTDALEDTHPTVQVVPPEEFRRVAFPDLTPADILSGDAPGEWEQLTKDPASVTRMAPLGIRYLIIVSGGTTTDTRFEASSTGAGAWGVIWDKQSILQAKIIDLKQGGEAGIVTASASGETIWLWPPAPLVIPTDPEGRACSELGNAIAKFLAGEKPPAEIQAGQLEEKIHEEWERTKDEDKQGQFIGHGYAPTPFE